MSYAIIKIGGSLLESHKSYLEVANYIKEFKRNSNKQPFVVVSALKETTDLLINAFNKKDRSILDEFSQKYLDVAYNFGDNKLVVSINEQLNKLYKFFLYNLNYGILLSFGEKISKLILSYALEINDLKVKEISAEDYIISDENQGDAAADLEATKINLMNLVKILNGDEIPIIEGFIAKSHKGNVTTLGRGGSDNTASIIAYSINAGSIYLVTDVPGIFTSDPKIVKNVKIVKELSYEEGIEASNYKVKGLNHKTFLPLINTNIKVFIGKWNNFNTVIHNESRINGKIKLIGYKQDNNGYCLGLIGKGIEKEKFGEKIKNALAYNNSYQIISDNSRPSVSIRISKENFINTINYLHEVLIGDE
ncbi:MAG: hypothetical protein ACP5M8_03685 [Caldisphaera sp.]